MKKKEPSYPREPAYCHPLLEAVQVGQYSSEAARRRPRLFVACSARSKIIWATVTLGGGLTALPWATFCRPLRGQGKLVSEVGLA